MPTAFKKAALQRVKKIHRQSQRYNRLAGMPHTQRLLDLMRKHVREISSLQADKDPHFLIETGDLLILCLELLIEYKVSPDKTLLKCCGRYENKLTGLIQTELKKHKHR